MNIFTFAIMPKGKRNIMPIVAAVLMLLVSGCARIDDVHVRTCSVKTIEPSGFRSVRGVLAIGIDNRTVGFAISGIKGVVKSRDKEIGSFSGGPVVVDGHSFKVCDLSFAATLDKSVSMSDLLVLAFKGNLDGYVADISARVRFRGGIGKTIDFKNVPLEKLIDKAE